MAFLKQTAGKKSKSAKQVDPTKPFPAPKTKGTAPATKGKKPALKIDIMLAKAMPGVSMPPKKGTAPIPKAKKAKGKATPKAIKTAMVTSGMPPMMPMGVKPPMPMMKKGKKGGK
jgi:hypothetical protein